MSNQREQTDIVEQLRIEAIARKYEENGYRVITQTQLPFGDSRIQADLIAISDTENVVVEVVRSDRLQNNEKLTQLASAIELEPGWRFELVVIKPEKPGLLSISTGEINERIRYSYQILAEAPDAALLYAWSAVEAFLRNEVQSSSDSGKPLSPLALVKTLYSQGQISRSAYEILEMTAQLRNAVAHGYVSDDKDVRKVAMLFFEVATSLIESRQKLHSNYSADDLVDWFFDNYEDPAQGVPYEGGYVYWAGGPYDPWDELYTIFPYVDEKTIDEAVKQIIAHGHEWVRKGQY